MRTAAWLVWVVALLALPVGVAAGGEAAGGNGEAKSAKHDERPPPPPGVVGRFILAHAQELNLTDDQKQKVQDWLTAHPGDGPGKHGGAPGKAEGGAGKAEGGAGKAEGRPGEPGHGPFADILTPEQQKKLRELLKAEGPPGGHPPPGGGQHPQR